MKNTEISSICILENSSESVIEKLNFELLELLNGTANQLLRNAKKEGNTLPNQDKLEAIAKKTQKYLDKLNAKIDDTEYLDLSRFEGNTLFQKIAKSMNQV